MFTSEVLKGFEFDKITERLNSFFFCPATREYEEIRPSFSPSEITLNVQKTTEFQEMTQFDGALTLDGLSDLRPLLRVLAVSGSMLKAEDLLQLGKFLFLCEEAERFCSERKIREKYPTLWENCFRVVRGFPTLRKKIERIIAPDGSILDTASDTLYQLRRKIRLTNERIEEVLNGVLQNPRIVPLLQERIYTVRKGRYVIPVKSQHRHAIDGVIVDYSSSGSTVFVEPKAIVKLDNELELLNFLQEEEITKILRQITAEIRLAIHDLEQVFLALLHLDLLQAKVRLGKTWEGVIPRVGGEQLVIRGGHHPLLGKKAVPFDLTLSPREKILVVSGPNAGGKTVLLKSLALIVTLTFCGIPAPLQVGSMIPFYGDMVVDIGDHQDLENELSTFTSRIWHLSQALQKDCSSTLFLIDELGSGTDPNEGTALAIATLRYLRERGATCIVTTHLPILKYRALHEMGVGVASLAINPDTLEPTYQLVLGEIGASYGIQIAQRVGLPEEVVNEARSLLNEAEIQLNELLVTLAQKKNVLNAMVAEVREQAQELARKEQELTAKSTELKHREKVLLKEFKQQLEQYLYQTKKEIAEIIGRLRKENRLDEEEYSHLKKKIFEKEHDLQALIPQERLQEDASLLLPEIREGDVVMVDFLKQAGTVVSVNEKKGEAWVNLGGRRVKVPLLSLQKTEEPQKVLVPTFHFSSPNASRVKGEIEIRSLTKEEALEKLDHYFDQVLLAGWKTVYVIHGKGEGVLRELTHEFLRNHPAVESFRLGYPEEGGLGVTVVTLKG